MRSLNWESGLIPLDRLYLRPLQRHFHSLRHSVDQIHWSLSTFYGTGRTYVFLPGGFPDFGYLDPYRPQAPYQLSGALGGSLCATSSLCGSAPVFSLPLRSSNPAGSEVCLRQKVVPFACMEAFMRHYKAAGFSEACGSP